MALPTLTKVTQTYEGESITCAQIYTTESCNLRFPDLAPVAGDYVFQIVIKSSATRTVTVNIGDSSESISATTEFTRQIRVFENVTVGGSQDLAIMFPAGTYYLYNMQLERANTVSAWRPAPEDAEEYTDAVIEAQTQEDIFNKLTNGGQTQGLFLENGRIYLNGTYIQSGTITVKKGDVETFYANVDTGEVRIKASSFSLTSGETLSSTLASAKSYADSASSAAVEAQTQADVFNKLTNNGQVQGMYLSNGRIYLNATYIGTGTLSADYISGGTIDATDVSIINLTVDHLVSYAGNNTVKLESEAGYLDIRLLSGNIWRQRVSLFNGSSSGAVRVSSGNTDANGNLLDADARRSTLQANALFLGADKDGAYHGDVRSGTVHTGTVSASGAGSFGSLAVSGGATVTGTATVGFINANTIGVALATSEITAANGTWSFSINGMRAIVIVGRTGRVENQSCLIPTAMIGTTDSSWGWTDTTGTTQFAVKRSGVTCTVTLKSMPSGGRLLSAYSLL